MQGHAIHPLLLTALRSDLSSLERVKFPWLITADAEAMLASAQWHGVLPLLARRLREHDLAELLPESTSVELRRQVHASSAQAMSQVATLLDIHRCAESEGIRIVPWKGPALAQLLYSDYTLRQSCDLDILVKSTQIARLTEALLRNGFSFRQQAATQPGTNHARRVHHEIQMTRRGHLIELHDEIMPQEYGCWLPLEECIDRAEQTITLQKQSLWCLRPADLLLSLCAHAAKHEWSGLKWICDIQAFLLRFGQSLDWDATIKYAQKNGADRAVLNGVLLSSQMLGTSIPAQVIRVAEKDKVLRRMFAAQVHLLKTGQRHYDSEETIAHAPDMVSGWSHRLAFRVRRFFLVPPQQVDEHPMPLFALHYPLRWILLTHKGLRLLWR